MWNCRCGEPAYSLIPQPHAPQSFARGVRSGLPQSGHGGAWSDATWCHTAFGTISSTPVNISYPAVRWCYQRSRKPASGARDRGRGSPRRSASRSSTVSAAAASCELPRAPVRLHHHLPLVIPSIGTPIRQRQHQSFFIIRRNPVLDFVTRCPHLPRFSTHTLQ